MKPLYIRQQQTVADPLQSERLLKALTIILEHQEDSNGSHSMRASRPVSNNTKAPSRVNGARSSTTFSTTDGRCCPSMSLSMMVSAAPGSIARPSTLCATRPGAVSSTPW